MFVCVCVCVCVCGGGGGGVCYCHAPCISSIIVPAFYFHFEQGGHKTGKHGKPGKLSEFEKCQNLRENSGKFEFL